MRVVICFMRMNFIKTGKYRNIYVLKDKQTNGTVMGKKYDLDDVDPAALKRAYKEWLFVSYTLLIEYEDKFYYDRHAQQAWIIMTNYGDTLKQRIKANGLINDENKVKEIAWDLLDKLWIIHNSGFVYCDIKPSNIVKREYDGKEEDESGDVIDGWKFIDFELIQKINTRKDYIGTFGWTAPEIKYDAFWNKYKPSSDIFSFGLIILYILCGEQPLEEDGKKRYKYLKDLGAEDGDIMTPGMRRGWRNHWYKNVILKSENVIKNKLVKLYYDNKISLDLFELLHDGILVYDLKKRWDCKKIYNCKWFQEYRDSVDV